VDQGAKSKEQRAGRNTVNRIERKVRIEDVFCVLWLASVEKTFVFFAFFVVNRKKSTRIWERFNRIERKVRIDKLHASYRRPFVLLCDLLCTYAYFLKFSKR
jgi:hypothetical protein